MFAFRKHLELQGHSPDTISIVLASWRESTKSQYQCSLNKWMSYCNANDINILSPSIPQVLDFLSKLYDDNASYSTINTAKSALSSFLYLDKDIPFGQLPLVKRFMKGVFEQRPSFPRHKTIWDLKPVFDYFRSQPEAANLTLKDLSMKTTFLLCLLSGQRCQTIKSLDIDHMNVLPDRYIFHINSKVKQTRPGKHVQPLEFIAYPNEEKLYVVRHLNEYIRKTSVFRKDGMKQLLLGFNKPHNPVSTDTISRWVKQHLSSAGVDTSKFKAHSVRSASSSYLAKLNVNVQDIVKAVGWSSERTFQTFYNKPAEQTFNFGKTILESFCDHQE